jgi:CHASE2 domain-containing sensor protein
MVDRSSARTAVSKGLNAAKRFATLRQYALFIVACVLAFALEHLLEYLPGEGAQTVRHGLFDLRGVYQTLVTAWPRQLQPRYTRIVLMNTQKDERHVERDPAAHGLGDNLCAQRVYTARLLPAIAKYEPQLIVLDKYFGAERCDSAQDTAALRDAIARVAQRVPVVVGLYIQEQEQRHPGDPYDIEAPVPLDGAHLGEGIVNVDVDARRLPLGWTIVRQPGVAPEWRPSLALRAAEMREPDLLKQYPSLAELIDARRNPFLSFIEPDKFEQLQSSDFICPLADLPPDLAAKCKDYRPASRNPQNIRGHIVVFGQSSSDKDYHTSPIGRVHGVFLQANYVEALLDERYFKPVPPWVDFAFGFVFFIAFEASLRHDRAHVCILRVAAVVLLTGLAMSLIVRNTGYYVDPIGVSSLYLVLKLIAWLSERITGVGKESHAAA